MTQIDDFKAQLEILEHDNSVPVCMSYIKYLMCSIIEHNQMGRALDRAIEKNVSADVRSKIYADFIKEKFHVGDEYMLEENRFCHSIIADDDERV